jgi:hypothetical protein
MFLPGSVKLVKGGAHNPSLLYSRYVPAKEEHGYLRYNKISGSLSQPGGHNAAELMRSVKEYKSPSISGVASRKALGDAYLFLALSFPPTAWAKSGSPLRRSGREIRRRKIANAARDGKRFKRIDLGEHLEDLVFKELPSGQSPTAGTLTALVECAHA